jgi:hypothetical protein
MHELCDAAEIAKTEAISINKSKGSREDKYNVTFHDQNKYLQQVSTAILSFNSFFLMLGTKQYNFFRSCLNL